MSTVTDPMALDATLQDVADALPSPAQGAAGKTAFASAVSGGYALPEGQFNADLEGLKWRCNPNLLDNWYFVGGGDQQGGGLFPINSKKQTSYSRAVDGINRWKNKGAGTVAISSSGIVVSGSSSAAAFFGQEIENPVPDGTVCTFSALSSDGTLYKATSAMSSASQWNCAFSHANGVGRVEYSTFALLAASAGKTATWVAVKLELGDTQTLAHLENGVWVLNEIPDYETQLLRCQRFYRVFTANTAASTGYGYSTNAKDLRPEMRANPTAETFTVDGVTYYALNANL